MKEIDFTDAEQLWRFAMENVELAEEYAEARRKYSQALKHLKLELALAYKQGRIERKHAEDKAYLCLVEEKECCARALRVLIEQENEYKAREKVLEARQAAQSFNQSLLKYIPK